MTDNGRTTSAWMQTSELLPEPQLAAESHAAAIDLIERGTIAGMLITDLIFGRANPWTELYDPARKPLGALEEFSTENLNVAAQYADLVTPGEVTDVNQIAPGDGAILRRRLTKMAVELLERCTLLLLVATMLTGCGATARLAVAEGIGPRPLLPEPDGSLLPTVNVVTAKGWSGDEKPVAAPGLAVEAFARGLDHPRWLHVLPNGDVLVAETNAPPGSSGYKGIKGWFFKRYQKKAGGAVPSANRITLLRDTDGDGVAEIRSVLLSGLNSPFGMALVGDVLYVANADALVRFPYADGQTEITAQPTKVVDFPPGPMNHHWTKSLIASADGTKLYVGIGSNSNVAEHGIDKEEGRAAIWEIDVQSGRHRIFASGLRNPVGMAWEPETGVLWAAVNERDEIGSDLVPDYMTSVTEGGFYGWPYSYFGAHVDTRVKPQRPDLVAKALVPEYALGPHTASLGLTHSQGTTLPAPFASGMFVGQHGSWNRKPRSGYKVIFVPFTGGRPSGMPLDVLTGFVRENGDAMGRPVGVAIDKRGALLVADDVGNAVWRVTGSVPSLVQIRPSTSLRAW